MNIALVHGLWNRGWWMTAMARRLRKHDHNVVVFSYPTRDDCLDGHADALHSFVVKQGYEELHLVGHSMGGLVILNMLGRYDDCPPGRVVLMGTPVKGAAAVKRLQKLPGQSFMFGKVREDLLQGEQRTPGDRETGVIAGTRALGFGQISGRPDEPNDGSVTVDETRLKGSKDCVELNVAHSEMLVSTDVVEQVGQFLAHGKFKKDIPPA